MLSTMFLPAHTTHTHIHTQTHTHTPHTHTHNVAFMPHDVKTQYDPLAIHELA